MIKKTLNQNAKYAQELLKTAEADFVFSDKPINRLKVIQNNNISKKKNKSELLLNLRDQINSIQNCNLKENSKNLIMGDGDSNSPIMLIGEAPGKIEDESGSTFQGEIGSLLNKMLLAINIKREEVYITNVVNWRPPNNRTPTDEEILEFLPYLQQQIDIVEPKYIFLLGGVAAKAILSTPLALGKLRGKWHEYKSLKLNKKIYTIASYHPAFLLRSPQFKKASWEDLKMLQKRMNDEK